MKLPHIKQPAQKTDLLKRFVRQRGKKKSHLLTQWKYISCSICRYKQHMFISAYLVCTCQTGNADSETDYQMFLECSYLPLLSDQHQISGKEVCDLM